MRKRILLIDDEELVVKSVSKLLIREGYEVMICRSGEEAIKAVEKQAVDLVICDIRMPRLDGIATVKRIREILKPRGKDAPEILITGYADEAFNKAAEELHVAEYLYKPFDLRVFLHSVKRSLAKV